MSSFKLGRWGSAAAVETGGPRSPTRLRRPQGSALTSPAASPAVKALCAPCVGLASLFHDTCLQLICGLCGESNEDVTLSHTGCGAQEARSEGESQTKQRRNPEEPEMTREQKWPLFDITHEKRRCLKRKSS